MKKIETGSKLIHRFDDALHPTICAAICEKIISSKGEHSLDGEKPTMPWHDGDGLSLENIDDPELHRFISAYRIKISSAIAVLYGQLAYPHFTNIVLWRPGKQMLEHKDDGYDGDDDAEGLKCRHFTTVTYCNDNYVGGETFIKNEFGEHYISTPKTGSVVIYLSDERNTHGVNRVIEGNRIALSTWYTRDVNKYLPQNFMGM